MSEAKAKEYISEIKKTFLSKNIWYSITEINEPKLKFIKIEASIKVKG